MPTPLKKIIMMTLCHMSMTRQRFIVELRITTPGRFTNVRSNLHQIRLVPHYIITVIIIMNNHEDDRPIEHCGFKIIIIIMSTPSGHLHKAQCNHTLLQCHHHFKAAVSTIVHRSASHHPFYRRHHHNIISRQEQQHQ